MPSREGYTTSTADSMFAILFLHRYEVSFILLCPLANAKNSIDVSCVAPALQFLLHCSGLHLCSMKNVLSKRLINQLETTPQ